MKQLWEIFLLGVICFSVVLISAAMLFYWMWLVFSGPFPLNWIFGIFGVLVWIYAMGKSLYDMYYKESLK